MSLTKDQKFFLKIPNSLPDISPINREIIDGKFYWQIIQTRPIKRTAQGEVEFIPIWESLFYLPNPGVTLPCEWVGSYKEEFTHSGYCYSVRLASHDGGESQIATFQTADFAKFAVETHAKALIEKGWY